MFLIYWDGTLVGMNSVLPMPSGTSKYSFIQHRLVVLPDYQGLGIGTKVNDFMGEWYIKKGDKYFIRTTHVRMNRHMNNDSTWKPTNSNNKKRSQKDIDRHVEKSFSKGDQRIAGSFEYMGEDYCKKPHKTIVIDDGEHISKEELLSLKNDYYLTVVTGKPKENNETESLCKSLGIRTEQLYFNRGGVLLKKKVN